MKILAISKAYHAKVNDSNAIQVRRILDALTIYGNHNITLITEGKTNNCYVNENLKLLNIVPSKPRFSIFEKVFDHWVCSLFCVEKNKYIKEGLSLAEKELKANEFDLLITFSTPMDSHIIGLEIKRIYNNLKWVTFFSDLWPTSLLPKPYRRYKLLSVLEKNLMQNVVEHCNGFITLGQYVEDLIKQNFKTTDQSCCVPPCLNENNFKSENKIGGFIVHSGFLQKERIDESLLEAVKELSLENSSFKGLVQIGSFSPKLNKFIRKHPCKNIVLFGHVPEELAGRIQSLFKIGIIIEAPMSALNPFVPSKIADSIRFNERIVAITPVKSFLTDFAATNKGIYCCTYDKIEIKNCFLKALNSSEVISDDTINYFHPANVAKIYSMFFDHCISN